MNSNAFSSAMSPLSYTESKFSMPSNTWRSRQTDRATIRTGTSWKIKMQQDSPSTEFNMENYLASLNIKEYSRLSHDEQRASYLEPHDAVKMLKVITELHKEVGSIKVENFVLSRFLEQNDPKLLIGIHNIHKASKIPDFDVVNVNTESIYADRSFINQSIYTGNQSIYTGSVHSLIEHKKTHLKLNYRAKYELCEKIYYEVTQRVSDIETRGSNNIKLLAAKAEELRYVISEIKGMKRNFLINFLGTDRDVTFMQKATAKQLEMKFRKFIQNLLKTAESLLETLRLNIVSVGKFCDESNRAVLAKVDSMILPVDFDKLVIRRELLQQMLDENFKSMLGLKIVTTKVAMQLHDNNVSLAALENEYKVVNRKIEDNTRALNLMKTETDNITESIDEEFDLLFLLRDRISHYVAPKIEEYISKKMQLSTLEKEEKIMHRKYNLALMKYNHLVSILCH